MTLWPPLTSRSEARIGRSAGTSSRSAPSAICSPRTFWVDGRIYYEVTFDAAVNKVSKFDRVIAFTDIDMTASTQRR
jgi:hypothetical protein